MRVDRLENKPACSVQSVPVPAEVTCPQCGEEMEIWSDENDTICKACGSVVSAV